MNDVETAGDEHTHPDLSLSTVLTGLEGGLFATIVMTVFREPTARALPPTAELLAQWVGGSREDYHVTSLAFHLLYGIVGGAVFAPILATIHYERVHPEATGLIVGSIYGIVLSIFGEWVVLDRLLDMDLDTDESAVFHAGHLVYGLALGVWVGSRA